MRNATNESTGSVLLVLEGGTAHKWVEVGTPPCGRIVRVAINQIGGSVEATAVRVRFYNAAAAEDSSNPSIYQCAPDFFLPGGQRGIVEFGDYPFRNADIDNVQSTGALYVHIEGLSTTTRTINVTFTVET